MKVLLALPCLAALAGEAGAARIVQHVAMQASQGTDVSHNATSALAGEAGAARIAQHVAMQASQGTDVSHNATSKSKWMLSSKRWCISSEAVLSCDDHSIIQVFSAFYANLPQVGAETCKRKAESGQESCEVDNTEGVRSVCQGKRQCTVTPSLHPSCPSVTAVRVVWECVAGSPATAADDMQLSLDDSFDASSDAGPEKGEDEDVEKGDMDDSFDEGKRVEFEAEAGKLEQDLGLNVSFNPCYRKTRLAKLFGRLTNCPEREGCFKLLFPNGTVFKDPEHPPSHDDIRQASLGEGADSLWVTWRSIGLKRNDYNTWGVCLPKDNKDGKGYAMAVFNTLKKR